MTTGAPILTSFAKVKAFMNAYLEEIVHAKTLGKPVIWHAMYFPRELVQAFDAVPAAAEWYAAASGPSQGIGLLETAEDCGFPHELCSYSRTHLGSMIANQGILGEFPAPDVAIGLEGICNVEAKWFEFMARYYNVPFFIMDYPPVNVYKYREDAERDAIEYFVQQAYVYIDFMEQALGQKLNEEKLITACVARYHTTRVWEEVGELLNAVPSPARFKNLLTFLPTGMALGCVPEATEVVLALRDELAQRVKDGVSGIPNEQIRLFWYGLVPYYDLGLFNYLADRGAAVISGTYFGRKHRLPGMPPTGVQRWLDGWSEPTNLRECLLGIAKHWIGHHRYTSLNDRIPRTTAEAKMANVDGLIFASTRMCRRQSKGEMDLWRTMRRELDIPIVFFEYSQTDPRDFSRIQVERAIDTFLEQIAAREERRASNG